MDAETLASTPLNFDWSAVDALTDEEIEAAVASDPDAPPILGPEWFAEAELVLPGRRKRSISIRLDQEVLDYFMAKGPGYQSRINAVLQRYVQTQRLQAAVKAGKGRRKVAAAEKRRSARRPRSGKRRSTRRKKSSR